MTDLQVTMVRPADVSDDERKRRLNSAYTYLLDLARKAETQEATEGKTLAGEPSVAGDASAIEPHAGTV